MIKIQKAVSMGVAGLMVVTLAGCSANTSQPSSSDSTQQTTSSAEELSSIAIDFSDEGFNPAETKAKVGEKVEFKNSSSATVQVNSAPHPVHTLFPELNIGAIEPGSSKSLTFSKVGSYTYHNHLNASQKGTIVVE